MHLRIRSVITMISVFAGCLNPTPTLFAKQPNGASGSFSICRNGPRINCVVDGDTFWFQGEKIRIADIDTPELSPPRCKRERELGLAAKQRLLNLLNEGSFSLASGVREKDRYGRKLRNVYREGMSFGDLLVAEGLARRWDGARRSWCE
jgi:micrococcal nuclease